MPLPALMPDDGVPADKHGLITFCINHAMGRSRTWKPSYAAVQTALARGDHLLKETGLEPEDWIGATLSYSSDGPRSPAYPFVVNGLWLLWQRFPEGWRLMDADKNPRFGGSHAYVVLRVRDEVKCRTREDWMAEIPSRLGFRN